MFHYFQFTGSQCFGVLFFVFVLGFFFIHGPYMPSIARIAQKGVLIPPQKKKKPGSFQTGPWRPWPTERPNAVPDPRPFGPPFNKSWFRNWMQLDLFKDLAGKVDQRLLRTLKIIVTSPDHIFSYIWPIALM